MLGRRCRVGLFACGCFAAKTMLAIPWCMLCYQSRLDLFSSRDALSSLLLEVLKVCENSKWASSIVIYVCVTKHSAFNLEHELITMILIHGGFKFYCGVPTSQAKTGPCRTYESSFSWHTMGVKLTTMVPPCIEISVGPGWYITVIVVHAHSCLLGYQA
jgi:hypothetical protein